MNKKPSLEDLGLDAPASPPPIKKSWQDIANEHSENKPSDKQASYQRASAPIPTNGFSSVAKIAVVLLFVSVTTCGGFFIFRGAISSAPEGTSYQASSTNSPMRIRNGNWPGCATKELMDKVISYANTKDEAAFERFMQMGEATGKCTVFIQGEEVFLVKGEVLTGLVKVRRTGETAEFWVAAEAIR